MADDIQEATNSKSDLTRGDILYHLRRLSLPMVLGIFAIISTTLIDTYYIGLLGTDELAAISFAFTISFAVFSLILGLGIGMSSVISRTIGSGDEAAVRRLTLHCMLIGAVFSVVLTIVGLGAQRYIFEFMGAEEHILDLILEYMNVWFFGIIFVTIPIIGNAAMRGAGDSFSPSMIMVLAAFINLILDPILIFGFFGLPAMGMEGAALASVIAYAVSMVPAIYLLIGPKKMLFHGPADWHLFKKSAQQFLSIGVPAGLANMVQPISNAVIVAILAAFSTEAVAGYGVAVRIQSFVLIPVMALATGMSPIVGQNWGAKRFDRVNETLSKSFWINIFWCVVVAALLAVFSEPVARIFSDDENVIRVAELFFWLVPITFIGAQTVALWSSAFNAAGYPQRAFVILNVKILGLYIPGAFIGSYLWDVEGVFIGLALANVLAGSGFHILNRRFTKQKQAALQAA